MSINTKKWLGLVALIAGLGLFGCAHSGTDANQLRSELRQKDQEIKQLTAETKQKDMTIQEYQQQIDEQMVIAKQSQMRAQEMEQAKSEGVAMPEIALLPPDARPGECYARVFVPPTYKTLSEQVLKEGAAERIEIVPAEYEWVEEQVLVKEASSKMENVPAQYDWVEEKILVKEAHTTWKKGRGLIEKVDNTTGEIMCLVEIPAEYKAVRKRVMVKPPATRVINIPAEYQTVKIKKMVSPPREQVVQIPASYQTLTRTVMATDGHMEWRKVLCETNMTQDMIMKIQTALKNAGNDPGPIDGIIGKMTMGAINSYQKDKGLATGALTYRTIESLGITIK
ncbi:MAG: peptidoglycan-binding protein [Deltaproteobacteria bacterium]|nr:peptidoglycan-binding protein [Deltaproteobacteria bacterium]